MPDGLKSRAGIHPQNWRAVVFRRVLDSRFRENDRLCLALLPGDLQAVAPSRHHTVLLAHHLDQRLRDPHAGGDKHSENDKGRKHTRAGRRALLPGHAKPGGGLKA